MLDTKSDQDVCKACSSGLYLGNWSMRAIVEDEKVTFVNWVSIRCPKINQLGVRLVKTLSKIADFVRVHLSTFLSQQTNLIPQVR